MQYDSNNRHKLAGCKTKFEVLHTYIEKCGGNQQARQR